MGPGPTRMNVRIASRFVLEDKASVYWEYLHDAIVPRYEVADGLLSVFVLKRQVIAYVELDILSFWESEPAMVRFVLAEELGIGPGSEHGAIHLEVRTYTAALVRVHRDRNIGDLNILYR